MEPKDCRYFISCSVNVCPLDRLRKQKEIHPLDKEKKCRKRKGTIASLRKAESVIIDSRGVVIDKYSEGM